MKVIGKLLLIIVLTSILASCAPSKTNIADIENIKAVDYSPESTVIYKNSPASVKVPILMFHDVKTYEGGTWSISAENFRKTLNFLLDNGYTPISFQDLVNYCDGKNGIPEKPVCITLDDGYYSNYRNVLPIVTEMKIPITVFMICGKIRAKGTAPDANEDILSKLSADEIGIMNSSPYVSVQSHTFALHGQNTSYGNIERNFALPLKNESKNAYKQIASKDCELAENALMSAGVEDVFAFSYPGGKVHEWFEEVLRERNYRVSVTSNSGNKNRVVQGKPETLFLLGRFNVNDETTEKELFDYLNS